ncbi:barstar-like protein [Terrimicrobium sacchariphilum]|uniref:Barstar-like protein n=1 Tax=Terrimicrobium sacchariphilum TaxID=690879 RepID=A0A146G507_TERSA|nr:barstar-like protein [Terrimicrobium sacchariphilum]
MISWLETTAEPRIARVSSLQPDIREAWLATAGRRWIDLDGRQMRDWNRAYEHLAREFDFPSYFGRNLDALCDCLSDRHVLRADAVVICLAHSSEVLADSNSDALAKLLDTLAMVANELSTPVKEGDSSDGPAIPFHVLLAGVDNDARLQGYPTAPDSRFPGPLS